MQNTHQYSFLASISALSALFVLTISTASAMESTSFRLYDEFPNYADRHPAESDSFSLNENGETWYAQPLVGASFQIVTAPQGSGISSESSSSSSSTSSDDGGGSGGGEGGHRGHRTNEGRGSKRPSAPELPGQLLPPEQSVLDVDFLPPGVPKPSRYIEAPMEERRIERIHYFSMQDPEWSFGGDCDCSLRSSGTWNIWFLHNVANTRGSFLLLLLIAYLLGYVSREYRPGSTLVSKTKKKSSKAKRS